MLFREIDISLRHDQASHLMLKVWMSSSEANNRFREKETIDNACQLCPFDHLYLICDVLFLWLLQLSTFSFSFVFIITKFYNSTIFLESFWRRDIVCIVVLLFNRSMALSIISMFNPANVVNQARQILSHYKTIIPQIE